MATAPLTSFASSTATTRNVRCLIVGSDFDLASGSFALSVDENLSIDQLKQHVLSHLPSESQERIGSELQFFKGFDLYTNANTNTSTPMKPKRRHSIGHSTSPIEDLLMTSTPEKTANKYFQRKYAMCQRASLGEYLPRGRKCEQSRIDVLISVPKFQLSEDLAEMEDDETETETEMDVGGAFYSIDADTEATVVSETPRKRKRDPVVDEAATTGSMMASPSKWQRAPCGRVVSVDTLRMRSHCKRCLAMK